jgi:molecular chaperone HscC
VTEIYGIDLGTTNSVIAYMNAGGLIEVVPNAEGEHTTPSVVHVSADGSLIVGRPALGYPTDNARVFKRFMGTNNTFSLVGRTFTPVDLSAAVLRKVAGDAATSLGKPVHDVVISVPAHFGQRENQATYDAAVQAGLNVIQLIHEPTAATNIYLQKSAIADRYSLVFDLGGGTFDVTLLEMTQQGPYIRLIEGATKLGGQDFNDVIVSKLRQQYERDYETTLDAAALLALNQHVEVAKCALSEQPSAEIVFGGIGKPEMRHTLTREEFEDAIGPTLIQIEDTITLLLARANLQTSDIGKVLLMGGSSRALAVRSLLHDIFGFESDASLNPDLSVAEGAALVGAQYARQRGDADASKGGDIVLATDSISRSVGVRTRPAHVTPGGPEYVMHFVLPKGYPLDKWSEPQTFHPDERSVADRRLTIRIYQGESQRSENNETIGSLPIDLSGTASAQTTVRVWMRQNRSSLLEMEVSLDGAEPHRQQFQLS